MRITTLTLAAMAACLPLNAQKEASAKTGDAAATAKPAREIVPYAQNTARKCARMAYFEKNTTGWSSPGQFAIRYGVPVWKPEYDKNFDAATRGKRWRFGQNAWTTLEANLPLVIGGVTVAPGYYYCVLERDDGDQVSLVLLDPAKIRKSKLDAFQATETKGGLAIPLQMETTDAMVKKLNVVLAAEEKTRPGDVTLEISWGPYLLSAKIEAKFAPAEQG